MSEVKDDDVEASTLFFNDDRVYLERLDYYEE
jgi:hypothetical protein